MEVSRIVVLTVFVILAGIAGLAFIPNRYRAGLTICIVLINAVLTLFPSILALAGNVQTGAFILPNLPGSVFEIRIDGLSAWFIILINFTTLNGALFGTGYLKSYRHLETNIGFHWICYTIFHISMIWVCMFGHGIMFLISWELMSLSSLMLVIFEYQSKKVLKAGINYLIQMHLSVILLTVGFLWIFSETGSFNLSSLAGITSDNRSLWIFILFFIGFAIKAGFLPFHTWLPHAHPAAPSHVSGVMSGVIVKLGIFGILRIVSFLTHDWLIIGEILLSLSVVTALYGIIHAAVKYDFKRSLAFCTIENIGIIGIGIGLGLIGIGTQKDILILLGFSGALLHTLNHSLFKSLLFFSAGSIYQQTHTRNIEKLGGLIRSMPHTAIFFLIGALAIGGLPPFNGFISEYLIYSGLFKGLISVKGISQVILIVLSIAGLVLVGGISILAFTRMFGVIFLGSPRSELKHKPAEAGFIMRLPQYLIVFVMFTIAVFPQFYLRYAANITQSLFPADIFFNLTALTGTSHSLTYIGRVTLVFVLLLITIYAVRSGIVKRRKRHYTETWGCGYVTPVVKAQYTGRSYARSFGMLFSFILRQHKTSVKLPKEKLYPENHRFTTYYFDIVETYLVVPLTRRITFLLNYFQFIQNGRIQSYVVYGLFFILLVFAGTVIGLIT